MSIIQEDHAPATLRVRRIGIDTYQEPVIFMRVDCHVCRSEGFETQSRVKVTNGIHSIIATMNVVGENLLEPGEAGLSEAAWRLLQTEEGNTITLSHPEPLRSLSHVRSKVYGNRLNRTAIQEIVQDVAAGRYSDVQLASFVTACAQNSLDRPEIIELTRAMVDVGDCIDWGHAPIVDKHCVGGLPGNRTTLIVVPIVVAHGLTMPKTSSRAITSPAGTADAMETLAPVALNIKDIRRVVDQEGGCIVWGGAVRLSPADDILIRVERALSLDSEGQLIASVLSKKVAAGSTHVVIDVPVGPTVKVRTREAANLLREQMVRVGQAMGLHVSVVTTDGVQPVGRGVGPALEAHDVLAVLKGEPNAPADLRERSLALAARVLELSGKVDAGAGPAIAKETLESGTAWKKFQAICEAQGGLREPPTARYIRNVLAKKEGVITEINNRALSRLAKLAGAPQDHAAGLKLAVACGDRVAKGEPLFTIHAESRGELDYATEYVESSQDTMIIGEE